LNQTFSAVEIPKAPECPHALADRTLVHRHSSLPLTE
jgi:hypothetical protein